MNFAEYVEYCNINGADTVTITTRHKFDMVVSKISEWAEETGQSQTYYWTSMIYKLGVCLLNNIISSPSFCINTYLKA